MDKLLSQTKQWVACLARRSKNAYGVLLPISVKRIKNIHQYTYTLSLGNYFSGNDFYICSFRIQDNTFSSEHIFSCNHKHT